MHDCPCHLGEYLLIAENVLKFVQNIISQITRPAMSLKELIELEIKIKI